MQNFSTIPILLGLLTSILISFPTNLSAQPNYTANERVVPYNGGFRAGVNFDIFRGFTDEDLATLAAGNPKVGVQGVGAKAVRPAFFEDFAEKFGYDSRDEAFKFYDTLGLKDNTLIVGFPSPEHQDTAFYCPSVRSTVFKNLYTPIWDDGANDTPVNDNNYYALYIWRIANKFKKQVKFWEIWNEPGLDFTGGKGWLNKGAPGNWWDNNPEPCDYKLRAPIQTYVRMLRISYEIIKSVDPNAYVVTSGLGFPAFLDAILRNTDNPNNGQVTPQYPLGGGAYFDGIGYHAYPHFDDALRVYNDQRQAFDYFRHSDAAGSDMGRIKELFDKVLRDYGYNGQRFPKKQYLITEANVPRKEFGDFAGSEELQRNWAAKAIVSCLKNDIHQLHVFKIAEETSFKTATYSFDVMGFYERLNYTNKRQPKLTQLGISYHSASQILFGKSYDAAQTQAMNLPPTVDGIALRDSNGVLTYVLWAKTTIDKSEIANATYSFPSNFQYADLVKRDWRFSETRNQTLISARNIVLTATPIFLTEQKIKVSKQFACENEPIQFEDVTPSVSRTWTIDIGQNRTATESAKTFSQVFPVRGEYRILLDSKDANGVIFSKQTLLISVEKPPIVDFIADVQTPYVLLKNLSSPNTDSIVWTFSDGSRDNLPELKKVFYQNGTVTAKLTAINRCGAPSLTKTWTINTAVQPPPSSTANKTPPAYNAPFRAGVNARFVEGWTDEQIGDIAAGNKETGIEGVAAKSLRTALPEYFTKFWGVDIRKKTYQHFENLDLRDLTLTLGSPDAAHRDPNFYCYREQSQLFKNMYLDIWNANNSVVNDSNYFAKYVSDLVKMYKNQVKFWEIFDTPGWDREGKNGWKPRNWQHNWWENQPDPCEIGTQAPVSHLVRMMRIAYEVIKREDSTAFVVYSGSGFTSFLDAVCRTTDNPAEGPSTVTPQYPLGGGAYFDAVLYNAFPHVDGSLANYDQALGGLVYKRNTDFAALSIVRQRDSLQSVLKNYGYDGRQFPKKRFIIGEINVPRKAFSGSMSFGSEEIQRNFILKSYVTAAMNGILQMNVKSVSEESDFNAAQDGSQVMGLYQKLNFPPPTRSLNIQGVAFKTTSELLFGLSYDSVRTRQLNLPQNARGGAFKSATGKYTYVLWSPAQEDLIEYSSSTYSFPTTLNINNLYRKEWTWTQDKKVSTVSSQNVALTSVPIFLSDNAVVETPPIAAFGSDTRKVCPPLTVKYDNKSTDGQTYLWKFDGGEPATSTERTPSIIYRQSGKYDVILEVRNAYGVHKNRKTEYVEVNAAPKANFDWKRDPSNPLSIQFTSKSSGSFTMIWDFGDGSQGFSLNPSHIFPTKKIYRVRLIAVNDCGRDTLFQNIDLSTNEVDFLAIKQFSASPNPFSNELTVEFSLAKTERVSLKLYNVQGKLINTWLQGTEVPEGVFRRNFPTFNLLSGVYLLQVRVGNAVFYRKVVKMN
ncbi:MAG: PKD domain-containing protein [Saprospiraceae bacterium]|nr:PKD domain-containing protein [Saprospiraceae bacterium]